MPSAKVTQARSARREHQFLAGNLRRFHPRQRRLDLDIGERQIAGDLIAQEHPDLLEEFAKRFGRGVLAAQQCGLLYAAGG